MMKGSLLKTIVHLGSLEAAVSWCTHGMNKRRYSIPRKAIDGEDQGFESKSIADYTLGLHGGKYQFDDSPFSAAGQEFAASLYSGGETEQIDYTAEEMPKWAVQMSELTADDLAKDPSSINSLPHDGQVTITNHEPTWERFYAFVLPRPNDSFSPATAVEPWVGMLSPRGGRATLQVDLPFALLLSKPAWLVVGTEEDRWIYSIL